MPYGGGYSGLSSKNNKLNQYNFIKSSKRGAILIEFAFAVPVLFSLIYYISDLAKIKQWNQRMDFATHCMASMFQNTSNITKKDVINILQAGRLVYAPDGIKRFQTLYNTHQDTLFQLGVLCVVGTNTNKCKVKWFVWSAGDAFSAYEIAISGSLRNFGSKNWNPFVSLTIGSEYNSSIVYPSLTINAGETKILLVHLFTSIFSDANWIEGIMGLHLAHPRIIRNKNSEKTYLQSIVVFTPKPGTFDPNNPPQ